MILIEDLWRQRVTPLWSPLLWNVLVHPEPLLLQHGDVNFLEANLVCLQETHHILLVFFYLQWMQEMKKEEEKKSVFGLTWFSEQLNCTHL